METKIENSEAILADFMKWMESRDYTKRTKESYRLNVAHFLKYLRTEESQVTDLKEIDRPTVARYRKFLEATLPSFTNAAYAQRNSTLKTLFKWLLLNDVILIDPTTIVNPNPALHLDLDDAIVQAPVDFFTEEEIKKIFSAHDTSSHLGKRNRVMIELMYLCGLRNNEVADLEVGHFDLENGRVKIPGVRTRELGLSEMLEVLKEYVEFARPAFEGSEIRPCFFLSKDGWRMESDEIMEVIQGYVERSGISLKAKNQLTILNSRAIHMLYDNFGVERIQWMLGFKDSDELMKTYRKLAAENTTLQDIEDYL